MVNVASTARASSMVTVHVSPAPTHGPVQPANPDRSSGNALRVTLAPVGKDPVHVLRGPHSTCAGSLCTMPLPAPRVFTVRSSAGMGRKVTGCVVSRE